MPKINFNTPIFDIDGQPQMRAKLDHTKKKQGAQGQLVSDTVMDENGYVIMEPIMLKEIVARVMNQLYAGEESLPEGDRITRGRLAHKIGTSNTANYRNFEVALIKELLAKAQATPTLMAHTDALINGQDFTMPVEMADDDTAGGDMGEPVNEAQKVA